MTWTRGMYAPRARLDPDDGLVHVVANDGVRFCGPWHDVRPLHYPVTAHHVTCVRCAIAWTVLSLVDVPPLVRR